MAAEVHIGDVGTVIEYTIVDSDLIVDISTVTSIILVVRNNVEIISVIPKAPVVRDRGAVDRVELTGAFATDGTDGIVQFTSEADTWSGLRLNRCNSHFRTAVPGAPTWCCGR